MNKHFKFLGREDLLYALKNINLNENSDFGPIKKGEFIMVRGPSGGGKTTFLNMIGTIDMPSSGEIKLLGSIVNEKSDDNYLSDLRL